MKKTEARFLSALLAMLMPAGVCLCDTFTNDQTKEALHGYCLNKAEGALTFVVTEEKGTVKLNLNEWSVKRDKSGRNNKVIVLPVDDAIMTELETNAFEQALKADANEGPVLILVEIDTPGGRIDLAKRMCAVITQNQNCDIIAFVKGGQYGGAISAGAGIALACNKIYMNNNTIIGAATALTPIIVKDQNNQPKYSYAVEEKMNSAWRAYLASLAQQNDRPGLMARAMVDRTIAVIEINESGKRNFVDPANKKPQQQVIHVWNKSGSLLTLTAQEAVECGIADGIADSEQRLLQQLKLSDANVIVEKKMANARRELEVVRKQLEIIRKSLDMKMKQAKNPQTAGKALAILRGAKSDFETLIAMGKKYPDLNFDVMDFEDELNSINAEIEKINAETRRRR